MIEWNKTNSRADTATSLRRVWKSKCGMYRVEYSECVYGNSKDRYGNFVGYPPFYRVLFKSRAGWVILGDDFRKRNTAMEAAGYHETHGQMPPKRKRKKAQRAEEIE